MKKKILIVSLLLLAGTAVAVFAAGRCTAERQTRAKGSNTQEWVQCVMTAGHRGYHEGRDSSGYLMKWN